MTRPRREDEVGLYRRLKGLAAKHDNKYGRQPGIRGVEDAARDLRIPDRRLDYILNKWTGKGWWNWGICAAGGWFEPESPESLSDVPGKGMR